MLNRPFLLLKFAFMVRICVFALLFFLNPQTSKNPAVNNGTSGSAQNTAKQKKQSNLPPADPRQINSPSTIHAPTEQDGEQQPPNDRIYKIKVVTPTKDTPLFPVYLWITGVGVFVNAAILIAILWQGKTNYQQMRVSLIAAKAARRSAQAASRNAKAAEGQVNAMNDQIAQMESAGVQTKQLIDHAASQVAQLALAAEAAKAQADATSKVAVVALADAQRIINSERPWMFIDIKTRALTAHIPGEPPESIGFSVKFTNYGKTPAEIINFDQHVDCGQPDELPVPPAYTLEGHAWAHTRMVPPGGEWSDSGEPSFIPSHFLVGDQWKDIRNSRQRLIYWGRLQYRDLIEESTTIHELKKVGTIHETCFCYFWSPRMNEFFVIGPLGYNKHT
jgi:hypothetical protein